MSVAAPIEALTPDPVTLAQVHTTLAGTTINAIRNLGTVLASSNESGDSQSIIDNDGTIVAPADPNAARAIADVSVVDCS